MAGPAPAAGAERTEEERIILRNKSRKLFLWSAITLLTGLVVCCYSNNMSLRTEIAELRAFRDGAAAAAAAAASGAAGGGLRCECAPCPAAAAAAAAAAEREFLLEVHRRFEETGDNLNKSIKLIDFKINKYANKISQTLKEAKQLLPLGSLPL